MIDRSSLIYLDHSSTTATRPEVVEAMLPFYDTNWGNASSIHKMGSAARKAMLTARKQLSKLINCDPAEIYFTPSGTYSNNTAILGRARFAEANDQGKHIIVSPIEHSSLLGPVKFLEGRGWKVTQLPVDREGFIDPGQVQSAITCDTSMISIMWANNEVGTIEPVAEIAELAAAAGIYFHCDAIQVPARLPIDVEKVAVSTLSLSGHKFYAPKGVGALFVRKGVNLMPLVFGGGQEQGLFPGTENIANIVGMGKAAELAFCELTENQRHLRLLQETLITELSGLTSIKFTGPQNLDKRLPGHVSLVLPAVQGESLVLRCDLKGVCVSSGSACRSGAIEPSPVLKAIGLSNDQAIGALRISAGKFNTLAEVSAAAKIIVEVIAALSPNKPLVSSPLVAD